jgi:hypothetical protein
MKQQHYFNNKQLPRLQVKNRKEADKLIVNTSRLNMLLTYTVLHFKFGFGKKRLDRFLFYYNDLLDSYNKEYITIEDLNTDLFENTGFRVF